MQVCFAVRCRCRWSVPKSIVLFTQDAQLSFIDVPAGRRGTRGTRPALRQAKRVGYHALAKDDPERQRIIDEGKSFRLDRG